MKTTRRKVLLLPVAIVLLLSAMLFAVFSGPREPSYEGKMLGDWVKSLDPMNPKAAMAIQAIGTNAIPYLLEWLQYEPPAWQTNVNNFCGRFFKLQPFAERIIFAEKVGEKAFMAFGCLGPQANVAIPELTELMNTSRGKATPYRAAYALGEIGEAGLPPLIAMLTNRQSKVRETAFWAIKGMGTNAHPALPVMVQCLTNKNDYLVFHLMETLGSWGLRSDLVVPALTNLLVHPDPSYRYFATITLDNFDADARPAVPFLQRLLNDSNAGVRRGATMVLREIAPEALTNTTVR